MPKKGGFNLNVMVFFLMFSALAWQWFVVGSDILCDTRVFSAVQTPSREQPTMMLLEAVLLSDLLEIFTN